jgi:AcrR family transcriptional regulator
MARVDLKRRGEIGRERRARSRAQLIEAARILFTCRPLASITVEEVTRQAGFSKGAFYSHFRGLDEMWAAVAAELAAEFEEVAGASRRSVADPVERIAAGCMAFIGEAQRDPAWGALIARGAWDFSNVACAARERLKSDLRLAHRDRGIASFSTEVGFDLVFGVVIQAMRSASEVRLSPRDLRDVVLGILRALGLPAEEAEGAFKRADAAAARGAGPAPAAI